MSKTVTRADIDAAVPRETTPTQYDHDDRVEQDGSGGLWVTRGVDRYHVTNDGIARWCVRTVHGEVAYFRSRGYATDLASADEAIFCLIGGPQS